MSIAVTNTQINPLVAAQAQNGKAAAQSPEIFEEKISFKTITETYGSGYEVTKEDFDAKAVVDDSIGFADFIDVVNPLQHIPVVSHFYRQATGDEIKSFAKIAGGGLFGGPLGAASAAANALIEAQTGQDITGHVFAFSSKGAESSAHAATNFDAVTAKYTHNNASRYN